MDTAFAQIAVDDAQAPPSSEAVAGPKSQPALSERTRRLLLGVAALTLVFLAAAIYHLADNWWYYNPF